MPLRPWSLPILSFCAALAPAQHGLDLPRAANTQLVIEDLPAAEPGELVMQRVFPNVFAESGDMIMQVAEIPDGSGRLVAVHRSGLIQIFPKTDDPQPAEIETFLDISDNVCTLGEAGLFSIAFDPDYATTGEFYVAYVILTSQCQPSFVGPPWRLSRFTNADPAGNLVNPGTEEILLSIGGNNSIHYAGMVAFGPDGMLYASKGAPFPEDAQDTTDLHGTIMRIDVNGPPDDGLPYAIPPDNPFVDGGPDGSGTRAEIFAYGLRNPWRFSFDSITGDLLVGDVGEEAYEEVNLVESGGNYGWPAWEGTECYDESLCDTIPNTEPIAGYPHGGGLDAVIAGFTYTGLAVPALFGSWLFAEIQGQLFGLSWNAQSEEFESTLLIPSTGFMIVGSGSDLEGEVYFTQGYAAENGIYAVRLAEETPDTFPRRLSDLPALYEVARGNGVAVDGVYPFRPSSQLWSDGARKERHLALPGLEQIGYTAAGGWNFPDGTSLLKTFLLPLDERDPEGSLKRIETRLLLKHSGSWHGFSFEWNEEESDGYLLAGARDRPFTIIDEAGEPFSYSWHYPSRNECMTCHTSASNHILGLNTGAMNSLFTYPTTGVTDNQLAAFDWIGLFDDGLPAPPEELPLLPDYTDETWPLEDRAKAYFEANCAMCHQPGGVTQAAIDFRFATPLGDMNLLDVPPLHADFGQEDPRLINTSQVFDSIVLLRLESTEAAVRMPPLATSRVDEEAVALIRAWLHNDLRMSGASPRWLELP